MRARPPSIASRLAGTAGVAALLTVTACSGDSSIAGAADGGSDALLTGDSSGDAGIPAADGAATSDATADPRLGDGSGGAGGPGSGPADAAEGPEGVRDAPAEAPSAAGACRSIGEACADAGAATYTCVPTWTAAAQASTWCTRYPSYRVGIASECDGYDIVTVGAVDTSTFYYYEVGTGALVGIEAHGAVGKRCLGGVAPGVPVTDCLDGAAFVRAVCGSDGAVGD